MLLCADRSISVTAQCSSVPIALISETDVVQLKCYSVVSTVELSPTCICFGVRPPNANEPAHDLLASESYAGRMTLCLFPEQAPALLISVPRRFRKGESANQRSLADNVAIRGISTSQRLVAELAIIWSIAIEASILMMSCTTGYIYLFYILYDY